MNAEYDLIPCPEFGCKHGYIGLRQCPQCDGIGKIIIPRAKAKPRFPWWLGVLLIIGSLVGLVVILGKL